MLLSVTSAFAQSDKPLSKMDTKDFITQVKELVSVGDIETAIDVYLEKVELIVDKNVAKGDRVWWESTKADLERTNNLFNSNDDAVKAAKRLFSNQEYWKCNEALSALKLDRNNARLKTIRQYNDLVSKMEGKQSILKEVEHVMPGVIELYEKKDIEQLFLTFFNGIKLVAEEDGSRIKGYVSPEYLPKLNAVLSEYGPLYKKYYDTYMETYAEPLEKNNSFPKVKDMGHNEAKDCLVFFKSLETLIKKGNDFPAAEFPFLAGKQQEVLGYISQAIPALEKRINETNPVNTYFKGGTMTLKQIREDCTKVEPSLESILALDVNAYYNKSFSTALQAENYKESSEYKDNLRKLQQLRKQVLNTVYYSIKDVNTGEYSLEHGCFFIEIGSNKGVQPLFPGMKPSVSHPNEFGGVVHESLTVASFTNNWIVAGYRNGDKYYNYRLRLPVSKSVAANLEKKDCQMVVCFVPAGVKTYRCMGADYDGRGSYDIFYANKTCPYSVKCRVLLFSKSGELLIDKIIQ